MFCHGHEHHHKQNVTNWATLLTKIGPSCQAEEELSERHEVSFTQTFQRRENVFPHDFHIPDDSTIVLRLRSTLPVPLYL